MELVPLLHDRAGACPKEGQDKLADITVLVPYRIRTCRSYAVREPENLPRDVLGSDWKGAACLHQLERLSTLK